MSIGVALITVMLCGSIKNCISFLKKLSLVLKGRRVATCKPGKPRLTRFSETLALFVIQFLSFRKMKVQDRRNGPSKLVFFFFHLKHHHVANIDIDCRGRLVRNSSPGLYHVNPGLQEKTSWIRAWKEISLDEFPCWYILKHLVTKSYLFLI